MTSHWSRGLVWETMGQAHRHVIFLKIRERSCEKVVNNTSTILDLICFLFQKEQEKQMLGFFLLCHFCPFRFDKKGQQNVHILFNFVEKEEERRKEERTPELDLPVTFSPLQKYSWTSMAVTWLSWKMKTRFCWPIITLYKYRQQILLIQGISDCLRHYRSGVMN